MEGRVTLLKDALRNLVASAEEQLRWLEREKVGVDELALDYDAIAKAADNMLREREITPDQYECITQLDSFLESFSGAANTHLWNETALRGADEWRRVREMAAKCLRLLNAPGPAND
jgi:hypothetical protein